MDNRSRLLESALRLFAARGYDAIGVQEICEAAGVTKPTLYHYFGNKRGLLEVLVQERSVPLLANLRQATAYGNDLQMSIRRVMEAYFQFAKREPRLYRLLLSLWFTVPDTEAFQVIATLNDQQQHMVEGLFLAATAQHGNMRGRHRVYAATLLGIINTYVGWSLNQYLVLDDKAMQQAIQQFSYGIYS